MLPAAAVSPTQANQPGGVLMLKVLPSLSPRAWAVLALLTANVIWGTTFVATKSMLERIPPLTIASSRFAIAMLVLLFLLAWLGRRPVLDRTTALMGLVGVLVVYACQNLGLAYTDAANGALIHGAIPIFTVLVAAPVLGERLSGLRLLGVTLSLLGVAAVVLRGSVEGLGLSLLGDGLVLVSALGLAVYLVLGRRAYGADNSLELVSGVAIFGLLFLLPPSAVELGLRGMERPALADFLGLAYLGAAASALAFVLWAFGLQHLEAGQAAVFANLNPLVGLIAAAIVLGEPVAWAQLAGGALILIGVWLVTRPLAPHTAPQVATVTTPSPIQGEPVVP
jgi:drug/metabolite transporter (DMT)-like permease